MSRRRRVIIDARSWFTRGGTGRYARNLVRALVPVAHDRLDLTVLLSKRHAVEETGLPESPQVRLVRSHADWLDFDEEAAALEADVDGDRFHSLTGHWLPQHVPSIATVHDLTPLVLALPEDDPLSVQCARMCATVVRAQSCLTDSKATLLDLGRLVPGVPRGVVVPLAADPVFVPRSASPHHLPALGLVADRFWLAAALTAQHKNLDGLLEAYEASGVRDPLVIVGRAVVSFGSVEDRIAAMGLVGRVRPLGVVDDHTLATLYATCGGFVRPSLYEGFGLPLLEAMACGAACLSSNTGSLPEVGGDAVLYFDPRDAHECARLMAQIERDAALRDDLRARAATRAAQFSWDAAARTTCDAYLSD